MEFRLSDELEELINGLHQVLFGGRIASDTFFNYRIALIHKSHFIAELNFSFESHFI